MGPDGSRGPIRLTKDSLRPTERCSVGLGFEKFHVFALRGGPTNLFKIG